MRKLLAVALAVVFMLGASHCFAEDIDTATTEYSYEIFNKTGVTKVTAIPTTSIRPTYDKLKAYEGIVYDPTLNAERFVAVYDDTSLAYTGERLGEKEGTGWESFGERWIRGKMIYNGIVVVQGANTVVTLYFVRK